uniref:SET domain-containing protein n=1 Tax=Panagrolaimus sp. ES5 TaxID=591445 RepID=A0AC34FZV2_9BILA
MFLKSKSDKIEMDVADFTGPIEIANIPGKGRGIIASEDIKAGTLLIVSKAFASGYSQDFLGPMNSATAKNVAQTLLINKAMKNLQKNPHRAKEVYDLYAGDDDMEKEEIPEGIIDAVRIIQIVEFNAFGFDGEANIEANLYILPSFFNHACPENACRTFYGDVMEVHAVVDVQKGKEICLSYISKPYLLDYSVRKEKFHDWNFTCNCRLCETDSKDEFSSKRAQMFAEFKEYAQANSKNHELVIAKGEKFLQQIRESYAKRNDFKIVLVELLKLLYRYYKAVKNGKECFKCWEEVVELVNKSCRYDIDLACMTYDLAHFLYKSNIAEKDGLVKKALEMSFCSDLEHFKMLNNV